MSFAEEWFNPGAFFILLRETLEAAVIVAILLRFMDKMNHQAMKKQVWFGAFAGIAVSVVLGAIFMTIFYIAKENLFSGESERAFKGVITLLAAALITVLAFAMVKMITWEKKFEQKLKEATLKAVSGSDKYAVFLLSFSAVFREGVESVLFLTGVTGNASVKSIIFPSIAGIAIGLVVGFFVYFSSKPLKLRMFYYVSMFILMVIAAGLCSQGNLFLSEAGWWGNWLPKNERNWWNTSAWDISWFADDKDNGFWSMMRAVFGFEDQPTHGQIFFWLGYWVIASTMLWMRWKHLDGSDKLEAEDAEGSDVEAPEAEAEVEEGGNIEGAKEAQDKAMAEYKSNYSAPPAPVITVDAGEERTVFAPAA